MNLLVNAAESIGERAGSIILQTGLANARRSDLAVAVPAAWLAQPMSQAFYKSHVGSMN